MAYKERVSIVIPARYASSRLPGKPLADLLGKPMIQWVYEKALQVNEADVVVIATDDTRIRDVVEGFGGRAVMTSTDHASGTDRLCEVMAEIKADVYINLQGDEPLVRSEDLSILVAGMKADPSVEVGTLCHPIGTDEAQNPNTVKVVLGLGGDTLYFSRAPIPYVRDEKAHPGYVKHVGVYAYRREALVRYSSLPLSLLEQTEQLEQLRLLSAGMRIRAFEVAPTGPGVDTPECLERVRMIMSGASETATPSLAGIKLVITDVDGVLTDGGIYYDSNGEALKRFHVRDGLGMRLLEESGVRVAVLSGRDSASLRTRVSDLGITLQRFGVKDKAEACKAFMKEAGVTAVQTACAGDDVIDLPAFEACGLSFAVADAPAYIRQQASKVLSLEGGYGAFRELADLILAAQGKSDVYGSATGFLTTVNNAVQ